MGVQKIKAREEELLRMAFEGLDQIQGLHILANNIRDRLGVISFYADNIHFNLLVRLLNDKYGIQTRGGCACAGTYGHLLLEVSYEKSKQITDKINHGDLSEKPGWVRWSLHPTMSNLEVETIINALKDITQNIDTYAADYAYDQHKNVYWHKHETSKEETIKQWFSLENR